MKAVSHAWRYPGTAVMVLYPTPRGQRNISKEYRSAVQILFIRITLYAFHIDFMDAVHGYLL